jgi:hypothetical protein
MQFNGKLSPQASPTRHRNRDRNVTARKVPRRSNFFPAWSAYHTVIRRWKHPARGLRSQASAVQKRSLFYHLHATLNSDGRTVSETSPEIALTAAFTCPPFLSHFKTLLTPRTMHDTRRRKLCIYRYQKIGVWKSIDDAISCLKHP